MSINAVKNLCELNLTSIKNTVDSDTSISNANNGIKNKLSNNININANECCVRYNASCVPGNASINSINGNPYDTISIGTGGVSVNERDIDAINDMKPDSTTSLIYALTLIIKMLPSARWINGKYILRREELERVIKLLVNASRVEVITSNDDDVGCCGFGTGKGNANMKPILNISDIYITTDDDDDSKGVVQSISTIPIIAKQLNDFNITVRSCY